jgi:hypothetical protein
VPIIAGQEFEADCFSQFKFKKPDRQEFEADRFSQFKFKKPID